MIEFQSKISSRGRWGFSFAQGLLVYVLSMRRKCIMIKAGEAKETKKKNEIMDGENRYVLLKYGGICNMHHCP